MTKEGEGQTPRYPTFFHDAVTVWGKEPYCPRFLLVLCLSGPRNLLKSTWPVPPTQTCPKGKHQAPHSHSFTLPTRPLLTLRMLSSSSCLI